MGLVDNARRAALALVGVRKATPGTDMVVANTQQGMGGSLPLGPGAPLSPAWGFGQTPRRYDYNPGRNLSTQPRAGARISYTTLRDFIDAYDVAQTCITHRIDSIRSVPYDIVPVEGVTENVDRAVYWAKRIMKKPDGRTPFKTFLNEYLWDILSYDAGCLYKVRNNAGQVIGLKPIDGTTIEPLLDGWGDIPADDAAAYVQIIHGVPTEWYRYADLVYEPYRKITNTPYGRAPLEAVLVNASSDVKYQLHFLRNYTAGNIPAMFGILPADMNPEQRKIWQESWDAFLAGDEDAKSQIHWVPAGTQFHDLQDKKFDKDLADWFLRKTCAAYHLSPQELGYIADVNRSNGETQENVQQRVGDKPLIEHLEGIFTRFLQEDMGLPVEFKFDTGGETEDRLQTAQSDKIYIESGVVSASDIAEIRFGIIDEEKVPRFIFTTKLGPIPVSSLIAASGPIDPETAEPLAGTTAPATQDATAAVQPSLDLAASAGKGQAAIAAPLTKAVSDERAAFRKYVKTRRARGSWRDFLFKTASARDAAELNKFGRAIVRKDAGQVAVAGLAVLAEDTGRVLMLQRALDPSDPASGKWEVPGGHLEDGEDPLTAATREWSEEVGIILPDGQITDGTWTNGHYQGFVYLVSCEADVPCRIGSTTVLNPDDPDGDCVETVAWWTPADMANNPAMRAELAVSLPAVYVALSGKPVRESFTPEDDASSHGEGVAG